MKEGQNVLQYEFSNIGGRRLQNLHSRIFLFLATPTVKDSLYYLLTLAPNIFEGNTTDLKPNSKNYHFINLNEHKIIDSIFSNCNLAIMVDYIDPLDKRKFVKVFYYQLQLDLIKG